MGSQSRHRESHPKVVSVVAQMVAIPGINTRVLEFGGNKDGRDGNLASHCRSSQLQLIVMLNQQSEAMKSVEPCCRTGT